MPRALEVEPSENEPFGKHRDTLSSQLCQTPGKGSLTGKTEKQRKTKERKEESNKTSRFQVGHGKLSVGKGDVGI